VRSVVLPLLICSLCGRAALADSYESVVRADPKAPFVTIVDASEPNARVSSVAELLDRQAGVEIRSRAGAGSFSSVSIRGSESGEVAILIDGIPLSRAASGTVDLSQLPVDGLERVEVYRGVPPLDLGSEAVGGAINLVTRKGSRRAARAFAGVGSYWTRAIGAGYDSTHGSVSLAYRGGNGDFPYYNYNGTQFTLSDDRATVRRNNHFDQVTLDASSGWGRRWRGRLDAHGFLKRQGVPGIAGMADEPTQPVPTAGLTTGRLTSTLSLSRNLVITRLQLRANLLYERYGFANPGGDRVGDYGAKVNEGEALSGGLSGRADISPRSWVRLTLLAEVRADHRRSNDLAQTQNTGEPVSRAQGGLSVGAELRLARDRLILTPGFRLDGILSTQVVDERGNQIPGAVRTDVFPSPRLMLRGQATRWLSLRGSAGRFVRFPTLIEQFGDGAIALGSRYVVPESAWGGDAGVAVELRRKRAQIFLESAFFGRHVDDLIAWRPSANGLAAKNIGSVRVMGVELRADVRPLEWLRIELQYTFLHSENFSDEAGVLGKQLPNRPRHHVFGRVELSAAPFRCYYDLDYADDVYRDPQNYNRLPARLLHGIGASVRRPPFTFAVDVRNLADLRVVDLPLGGSARAGETTPYPLVDFFDYPLPGRTLYATLTVEK
jgi:outer membrane receptor protein involved in Fe transport